jgi:hypothetical protein
MKTIEPRFEKRVDMMMDKSSEEDFREIPSAEVVRGGFLNSQ